MVPGAAAGTEDVSDMDTSPSLIAVFIYRITIIIDRQQWVNP
jgi:hypothetical protein